MVPSVHFSPLTLPHAQSLDEELRKNAELQEENARLQEENLTLRSRLGLAREDPVETPEVAGSPPVGVVVPVGGEPISLQPPQVGGGY